MGSVLIVRQTENEYLKVIIPCYLKRKCPTWFWYEI